MLYVITKSIIYKRNIVLYLHKLKLQKCILNIIFYYSKNLNSLYNFLYHHKKNIYIMHSINKQQLFKQKSEKQMLKFDGSTTK